MRFLSHLFLLLALAGIVYAQDARLREGDQLDVRFGGVPADETAQLNGQYQVDGQGYINMPHIGKIKALGSTQAEVQMAIENAYRSQQIYTNPTVTINMTTQARFVNVNGDVKSPRRVEFTADLTVLSAITAAGGFTEYANQKKVKLLRDGQVILINVEEIRKDPTKNLRLKPGDSLEVPQSFW